ncbi:hypothetical protein EOM82_09895, partial [bacterium]|nr:hypothetical protein [bacterium]
MSWVCKYCNSNNDDESNVCVVCNAEKDVFVEKPPTACTLTQKRAEKLIFSKNLIIPEEYNIIGEGAFKNRKDITPVT